MGEGQLSRDTQRQRDSRRDSEAQPRKGEKKKGAEARKEGERDTVEAAGEIFAPET